MESKTSAYDPLMASDARSSLADDTSNTADEAMLDRYQRRRTSMQWAPNVLVGAVFVLIWLLIALIAVILTRKPTDLECSIQLSTYSPAMEAVEYIEQDFSDAFNSTSKYRGPPTQELEDAWENLTFTKYKHAIEVPLDKLRFHNRTEADHMRKVPPEVGTGYVALIEVFHQLHCLNLIRRYTWFQAGKYDYIPLGLSDNPLKNRMHVDHCFEALRIAIQCYGDITPLFIREDADAPAGARADFDTHHKCRNFDKLEEWIDTKWVVY